MMNLIPHLVRSAFYKACFHNGSPILWYFHQDYTNTINREEPITTNQDNGSMENVTNKEATNQNYQHSSNRNEKQPSERRKKKTTKEDKKGVTFKGYKENSNNQTQKPE